MHAPRKFGMSDSIQAPHLSPQQARPADPHAIAFSLLHLMHDESHLNYILVLGNNCRLIFSFQMELRVTIRVYVHNLLCSKLLSKKSSILSLLIFPIFISRSANIWGFGVL